MESSKEIYDKMQSGGNKALWAYAQELHMARKKLMQPSDSIAEDIDWNDKEAVRLAMLKDLYKESRKGNAQASDKLGKWAGLEEEKQDIIIEVVNYNPPKRRKKSAQKS